VHFFSVEEHKHVVFYNCQSITYHNNCVSSHIYVGFFPRMALSLWQNVVSEREPDLKF